MAGNILGGCLFESILTIWCSSLLEDAKAILSVSNLHLAVCTSFEILCFACLYKSLKIVEDNCSSISSLLDVFLS